MKHLHELASQTLLGTERRTPAMPSPAGALGELLAVAAKDEAGPEVRILRLAGTLAVCADCGFVPAPAAPLPPPCPTEERKTVDNPALTDRLGRILADGPDLLRREALRILAGKGAILPPRLLPRAFALAQQTPALWPALLPVVGQRGRWLAGFNPAWSPALAGSRTAPDLKVWEEGTQEQRKQVFAHLRQSDPEQARRLLSTGYGQLDARERAGLLAQLAIGLDTGDEAMLEAALADRSKEVRLVAGSLLARLPNSRYVARMGERLAACLHRERKLFRQILTIEPPPAFLAEWKADALEEGRNKSESLGERAWWLYQIVRGLPLSWWPAQTGMTPAELTKWALKTDWSEALFRAWGEALMRQPDAGWASAFLAHAPQTGLGLDHFDLLACLPLAERESHWLALLEAGPARIGRGNLLARIVHDQGATDTPLSANLARRVLREIRAGLPGEHALWDYVLRQTLPEFVCLIPSECYADACEGWPLGQPETAYFDETMARILAIVEHRKALNRTFNERPSP